MSLPAVTARLYSSDEVQYFSYLRSLWFDRDVSFENEYRYFYDRNIAQSGGFHETFLERETAVGRRVNYGTIGCAILWSPFYAVADVWTRATGAAEADGFSKPYVKAVAYGSAFYGFVAILLSIRAARFIGHGRTRTDTDKTKASGLSEAAGLAGVAVWLGTPLLFYMYVAPPFSHACSAFGVALFVNIWLHVRERWSARGAFVLGLSAALLAMIREQDVFVALGPAVDFLLTFRFGAAIAGIAGFAVGYMPQLIAYNGLNGYPGPAEHVARKMYWYAPHGLEVLFSPRHGFFFWTPLALLALVGLVLLLRGAETRRVAACALLMVASQVYVAGSVASWTVAGAFGQRRFVCLTVLLVIGISAVLGAVRKPARLGIAGAVAIAAWWNVALMFQFATGLMDRQRLEPGRNAYHAFVTIPLEAPSLAYRYLFDRASFYRPTPARPQ